MATETEKSVGDDNSPQSILSVIWPHLLVTALLSAFLVLVVVKMTNKGGSVGNGKTVVFDVIKLANAQRAVASTMFKDEDKKVESTVLLLDVSKRTRESIEKIAGKGTLVLVKQGVVAPTNLPDITDDVLKDLGLPTKIPTQDTMGYLTDVAPTYLSMLQQPKGPTEKPVQKSPNTSILP